MLRTPGSSRGAGGRDEGRHFHPVFLSVSESQDGAEDGAEDGECTKHRQKQPRLDAEHSECPGGSPSRVVAPASLTCRPSSQGAITKGLKRPELGQNSIVAMVLGLLFTDTGT